MHKLNKLFVMYLFWFVVFKLLPLLSCVYIYIMQVTLFSVL